ncbi:MULTISPECIES: class II SORL domain-containing protein [Dictyoglomus]|jgi:superoxide reductase|uniref:Superoxide reductase n=1 Tax=Dictyoglomus turgidum (strain DSM 6724 / Z-1310) TaxID=515635 RepID=B8E1U8_DICTD|nr:MULTISPECIES: class II SORL domain-containing protein [Dictyoglomus]ACK41731.1 Superoxide reductase [Dictyoglomus turgidum DSM 6724]PNV79597.1 MAG: superoxide reductase [Dictyoglomus turgidum]HBU31772.1 superoxide reductase [Dictyoglomus sp.]
MVNIKDLFQSADWAKEKHVPVIEILEKDKEKGVRIRVSVGKEIPHPNTTAHHIAWIEVYFQPEGDKYPYHVGRFEFVAHGATVQGPDTSTVYSEPVVEFVFKTQKDGVIFATSYCNIHGLWENSAELKL